MGTQNSYKPLGRYAAKEIKMAATRLVGHEGFTESDCEDIEQDLALDLLRRMPKYDPARSSHEAFVSGILRNSVRMLIAARKASNRDYRRRACSLNELVPNGEGGNVQFVETLSRDADSRHARSRTEYECADLRIDIAQVLEALPPKLRWLCEELKQKTLSQVSKESGLPRSTLYDDIAKIRAQFNRAGLQDYLPETSDTSRKPPVCR